ncbi:site-2 protease family protein, partial [Candidatus Magnetaquicoccus inordinatus]|uniref:site-2 protease family protein n=1 Tax=Candidatus Magnetaquicoccus inordinatus TaxID=2496818 RepID=UPI0030B9848D
MVDAAPPYRHGQAMVGNIEYTLPPLREELRLYPAPAAADGSPSWTLADPARHSFYRIGWLVFEILCRWQEADPQRIVAAINRETTLSATLHDVDEVRLFLLNHQLLRPNDPVGSKRLYSLSQAMRSDWATWLLHHYLFFRIPLWRPDGFLNRTLPSLTWLFSPWFRWGLVALFLVGMQLLLRQWDLFWSTVLDNINGEGLLAYGITLSSVKIIHELGHAYAAKRCDCRVPTMGVAFLVMWPVLYTDTTEAWKLAKRSHRLSIAAAGVAAEAILTVLALFAWSILPPGLAKNLAFWVSVTSLSLTLAINLSPFMRFDGYFILCDLLNMANLHERSFQYTRWWLREWLFGLRLPAPETTTASLRHFFILFALLTWSYRLILFLGIAVLVYHFFIKAVGIFLFAVEIGWFVILPIWREVRMWKPYWLHSKQKRVLLLGLALILSWMFLPWSTHIAAPSLLQG